MLPMFRAVLTLCLLVSSTSQAQKLFEWTDTNVELLTGDGFELGTRHRSTFTVEHANGWRYGENYLFVDVYQRDDVGLEVYGEWYPRVSLNKLTGRDLAFGIVKDFSLVGGINAGTEPSNDPFMAYFLGAGISFDILNADFVSVDFMARKADDVNSTGLQITSAWSIPFSVGRFKFKFRGFADWVDASGSGGVAYLLTQPQFVLDVGDFFGNTGKIYAGIEYWYWHNKFGIDGVDEKAAQALLIYQF